MLPLNALDMGMQLREEEGKEDKTPPETTTDIYQPTKTNKILKFYTDLIVNMRVLCSLSNRKRHFLHLLFSVGHLWNQVMALYFLKLHFFFHIHV